MYSWYVFFVHGIASSLQISDTHNQIKKNVIIITTWPKATSPFHSESYKQNFAFEILTHHSKKWLTFLEQKEKTNTQNIV